MPLLAKSHYSILQQHMNHNLHFIISIMKHLHQFKKYFALFFLLFSFQTQAMELVLTSTTALHVAENCFAGLSLLYAWLQSKHKNHLPKANLKTDNRQPNKTHEEQKNISPELRQALVVQKQLTTPGGQNQCYCGCCTTFDCGCTCGCRCDSKKQKKRERKINTISKTDFFS